MGPLETNKKLIVIIVSLTLSFVSAEEFDRKAKGFGFDVIASNGATAISMEPPQPSVKTSGGNFKYEKVDAELGPLPPFANNVIALVEAKGPKLNVEGDYPKWKPKIVKEMRKSRKIKIIEMKPLIKPIAFRVRKGKGFVKTGSINTLSKVRDRIESNKHTGMIKSPRHQANRPMVKKTARNSHKISSPIKKTKDIKRASHKVPFTEMESKDTKRRIRIERNMEDIDKVIKVRSLVDRVKEIGDAARTLHEVLSQDQFSGKIYKPTRMKRNMLEKLQKADEMDDDNEEINGHLKDGSDITGIENYSSGMKTKVDHVINEAKQVLTTTDRVVRGLKRVISGAKKLTEFTNNAVKFAKYFAMEPSNATVDYFEEKAVIAVLEAQKSAAEAKIQALVAKEAAKNAKEMLRKVKRNKNKKLSKKLSKATKYIESQVKRAKFAAKKASKLQINARNDAVVADKSLRKMVRLIKPKGDEVKSIEDARNEQYEEGSGKQVLERGDYFKKRNTSSKVSELKFEKENAPQRFKSVQQNLQQEPSKGEENSEENESSDATKLYENIKTELAKAELNNKNNNYVTNNSSKGLASLPISKNNNNETPSENLDNIDQAELEGGGDENEVIANDFRKEDKTNGNLTNDRVLDEREIEKGPLNVVVTVKRKQANAAKLSSLPENHGKEEAIDDPFDFKQMFQSTENNDDSSATDPFVYSKKSNVKFAVNGGRTSVLNNNKENNGELNLVDKKMSNLLPVENAGNYNDNLNELDVHERRSLIPVRYNQYEYIGNRKKLPNFLLLKRVR